MGIMERQAQIELGKENITVGNGIRFERIRRITGYLVGTLERFNDAKAAEERDRVKHISFKQWQRDHAI